MPLHFQATFFYPASLSLGVLSTRHPPGASPSSFTCKPPFSMLHHHLLLSSAPGALLEHLHPPPRASRLHPPHIVSWCPHHRVFSWGISTLLRIPPQMLQLACALLLPQHVHQVASLLCSPPACPAAGFLSPTLAPMGHCLSHHEPQHGFAIQPRLGDNLSTPFPGSACATTSRHGLRPGETTMLPTQLLPFPPCSRHRPQLGCQDGDRHRRGQPG